MIGEHINDQQARMVAELKYNTGFQLLLSLLKQGVNNDVKALMEASTDEAERRQVAHIRAKHELIVSLEAHPEHYWEDLAIKRSLQGADAFDDILPVGN